MSFESLDTLQDLEIYAQINSLEAIEEWLRNHFGELTPVKITSRTRTYYTHYEGAAVEVFLCRNAGHTGFSSITFNRKNIPWQNDVELGRAAYQALGVNIRCSESAWKEGDDPDQWFQIGKDGEGVILWPTEE